MAMLPPPSLMETSIKAYKSKDYPEKAKGMSFFAFLFSIFIYFSIFYFFKLSPTTLLSSNKFWFFISNTLIFIIATDYGVFSSSKEKQDIYEEYVRCSTQARNNASSFVSQYPEIVKRNFSKDNVEILQDKKEVITPKSDPPERILEVINTEPTKSSDDFKEDSLKDVAKVDNEHIMHKKVKEARKVGRSKSERYSKRFSIPDKKKVMCRSVTEKHEPKEEDNEFANMSDEELHRRVEEFIQRFNRQIRLQRESELGHL